MKAVLITSVVAAITINYFASSSLNSLATERLFNTIRDEAAILDTPHDPFVMLFANEMADYSAEQLASTHESSRAEVPDAWASNCGGYAGITQHPDKELKEHDVTKLIEPEIAYTMLVRIQQFVNVTPAKKEIQVAKLVFEEPVRVEYEVNIYPNPFNTQATFEIGNYDGEPYRFAIYDLSGKMIEYRENVTDNRITIYRNDLAPGVYIYRMVNVSESNIKSGKIIIQ